MAPLLIADHVSSAHLDAVTTNSAVPVWVPGAATAGWRLTGLAHTGDGRAPAGAVALAASGPAPLGGPADMVLIAEEPGIGLGAHLAGLEGVDPGFDPAAHPDAHVKTHGHSIPLWSMPGPADRSVFVGEGLGCWLWVLLWPATAGYALADEVMLSDARSGLSAEPLYGPPCPRLSRPRPRPA